MIARALCGHPPPVRADSTPLVATPAGKPVGMKGVVRGDKGAAMVKDPDALKAIAKSNPYDWVEKSIQ